VAEKLQTSQIMEMETAHYSGGVGRRPVAIVRAHGARLWDSDGKEYIDCAAGHGWANTGHCHPAVTQAIETQAPKLIAHTESAYNDQRALWFRELAEIMRSELGDSPRGPLSRIHPCNSGTEAIESAIKAARLFTGRPGVVAMRNAFHGRTLGALSATWNPKYRKPFEPLVPGFEHVAFNDADALDKAIDDRTAAILIEVVQGEGGVHPAQAEFLSAARRLCDERGALLIADEIQTGLGRTGRWFASQLFLDAGFRPDIIALGKSLGGGVPMGAAVWREDLGSLPSGAHGSTFGGNPLACAASRAVLGVLRDERLPERAERLGAELLRELRAVEAKQVREVRGLGLMIGIQLRGKVTPLLKELMDRGVWALPAGPTVLRLLPPLVISEHDLNAASRAVREVLGGG